MLRYLKKTLEELRSTEAYPENTRLREQANRDVISLPEPCATQQNRGGHMEVKKVADSRNGPTSAPNGHGMPQASSNETRTDNVPVKSLTQILVVRQLWLWRLDKSQ
jgi:hypothetical protein